MDILGVDILERTRPHSPPASGLVGDFPTGWMPGFNQDPHRVEVPEPPTNLSVELGSRSSGISGIVVEHHTEIGDIASSKLEKRPKC